jgi:hypothetical protein
MPLIGTRGSGSAIAYGLNGTSLLPGLFARYDASVTGSLTLSGSNVTQWNDISGNGYHLNVPVVTPTPTTPGTSPTYSATAFNSKPGLIFNGISNTLATIDETITFGAPGFVLFMVASIETPNVAIIAEHTANGNDGGWYLNSGRGHSVKYAQDGTRVSSRHVYPNGPTWATDGGKKVITFGFHGINKKVRLRSNKVEQLFDPLSDPVGLDDSLTGDGFGTEAGKIFFMSRGGAGIYVKGTVSEIIICKADLTNSQIAAIEDFLINKWSINSLTAPVSSNLVLHYDAADIRSHNAFDTVNLPATTGWQDLTTNAKHLTNTNATYTTLGSGGSWVMNGTSAKFQADTMAGLLTGKTEATVSLMYKSLGTDTDAMVWDFCNTDGNRDRFSMRQNWTGGQTTGYNSTAGAFGTATFGTSVSNVWKHYVFTRRGGQLFAYVDGVLNNSGTVLSDANNILAINRLIIAQDNINTNFAWAEYGNFLVYDRGLTGTEISQLFDYYRNRYAI